MLSDCDLLDCDIILSAPVLRARGIMFLQTLATFYRAYAQLTTPHLAPHRRDNKLNKELNRGQCSLWLTFEVPTAVKMIVFFGLWRRMSCRQVPGFRLERPARCHKPAPAASSRLLLYLEPQNAGLLRNIGASFNGRPGNPEGSSWQQKKKSISKHVTPVSYLIVVTVRSEYNFDLQAAVIQQQTATSV